MVDISKIRAGDKITDLVAHESAPRPVEVGSYVTWGDGITNWDVTAISGQRAWLTRGEADIVRPIADLRHVD